MPTSFGAMLATLPLTAAVMTGVLLHLSDEGGRREAALRVQLAPLITGKQQGLALVGSF